MQDPKEMNEEPSEAECGDGRQLCISLEVCALVFLMGLQYNFLGLLALPFWRINIVGTEAKELLKMDIAYLG